MVGGIKEWEKSSCPVAQRRNSQDPGWLKKVGETNGFRAGRKLSDEPSFLQCKVF